jgi:hypothetical protein
VGTQQTVKDKKHGEETVQDAGGLEEVDTEVRSENTGRKGGGGEGARVGERGG